MAQQDKVNEFSVLDGTELIFSTERQALPQGMTAAVSTRLR
jgi:hypothetical protein